VEAWVAVGLLFFSAFCVPFFFFFFFFIYLMNQH